jgi:glycosyltransferase involved in cell wall biosynthesis
MPDNAIAVLIPCYNESVTIERVIEGFRASLPTATIYVFDNNSRDDTIARAQAAGAQIRRVSGQGKGNVVRRMFADIEADTYVLVDGDDTYDAASAPGMITKLLDEHLDMVVGARVHASDDAYRTGHQLGNRLLTGAMTLIFGKSFTDMLSGYRVFSRRFVKSFPAASQGFETETELTIHAMQLRMPCAEVATPYGARPSGSTSKLHTYTDGLRIFATIIKLFAVERPLRFYSLLAGGLALIAIALGIPLIITYLETGLVPRLPTAILCTGLMLLSALTFFSGLTQQTIAAGRRETKHFHYLQARPPAAAAEESAARAPGK